MFCIFISVSPESIVIPIVSCIFGFPLLALLVICCLRHRAKMARERDRRRNYDLQDHAVMTNLVRFSPIHRLSKEEALIGHTFSFSFSFSFFLFNSLFCHQFFRFQFFFSLIFSFAAQFRFNDCQSNVVFVMKKKFALLTFRSLLFLLPFLLFLKKKF